MQDVLSCSFPLAPNPIFSRNLEKGRWVDNSKSSYLFSHSTPVKRKGPSPSSQCEGQGIFCKGAEWRPSLRIMGGNSLLWGSQGSRDDKRNIWKTAKEAEKVNEVANRALVGP